MMFLWFVGTTQKNSSVFFKFSSKLPRGILALEAERKKMRTPVFVFPFI